MLYLFIIRMVLMDTYVSDGICEFTDLFIADNYRNKGLGESVVNHMIDFLLKKALRNEPKPESL